MKSTIERAFEIARSGAVATMGELRARLKTEGVTDNEMAVHFNGKAIKDQLKAAMDAAKISTETPCS